MPPCFVPCRAVPPWGGGGNEALCHVDGTPIAHRIWLIENHAHVPLNEKVAVGRIALHGPLSPLVRYWIVVVALYCSVLYCSVLYCSVLYCAVLCCVVLYRAVLYCTRVCVCVCVLNA